MKISGRQIVLWVLLAFALYAIFVSPQKSAGVVQDAWGVLVTAVHSVGTFFGTILGK